MSTATAETPPDTTTETPAPTAETTPTDAPSAETPEASATQLGRPDEGEDTPPDDHASEVPDSYDLRLPERSALGEHVLPELEAEAKALGLTTAQAARFVEARNASVLARRAAFEEEARTQLGPRFDQTVDDARRFLRKLAPAGSPAASAFIDMFESSGYGNHPAVLEAFASLGRAMREDTPPHNQSASQDNGDPLNKLFPKTAKG